MSEFETDLSRLYVLLTPIMEEHVPVERRDQFMHGIAEANDAIDNGAYSALLQYRAAGVALTAMGFATPEDALAGGMYSVVGFYLTLGLFQNFVSETLGLDL